MRRDSPYVSQYNKRIPIVKHKLLFLFDYAGEDAKAAHRKRERASAKPNIRFLRFCARLHHLE